MNPSSTKQRGEGTGLGLSSVYGIINNHDGAITVYSEKGLGSTFTIFLAAVSKTTEDVGESNLKIVTGHGTILLVDDEAIVREVNQEILTELGYRVLNACNGRQALDIYKEKRDEIDLVILDMIMPEMDGAEVFAKLRELTIQRSKSCLPAATVLRARPLKSWTRDATALSRNPLR